MGKLRKIQKNAKQFEINNLYQNMTPQQYRESIKIAVQAATDDLTTQYNAQLKRLQNEYNKQITESIYITVDTFSIEFLYELADRLECFKEEPEYLDQKIDLVQGIYEKVMGSIETYANIREDGEAYKAFKHKRDEIERVFHIYKEEKGE